jgi:hypothetical protein
MDLRPELLPPPVAPQRIDALAREIERICGLLDGSSPDADLAASAIADFNAMTSHAYAAGDFAEYYASQNAEDFALDAARPAWPAVPDISRDELVEVTQRILDDPASPDCPYYLLILQANVQHPMITRLFWPTAGAQPTAEEIIDEALAHQTLAT